MVGRSALDRVVKVRILAPQLRTTPLCAVVIEQGRRVYLRAPRASDRDEFLRLARASRELHRPWVYAPETPREFAAYLARCSTAAERCFLVCRRDDDALAGVYNVSQIVARLLRERLPRLLRVRADRRHRA